MTVHVPTPQLQFRDLTLGYDRHPAVHHLSGDVPSGEAFTEWLDVQWLVMDAEVDAALGATA